MIENPAPESLQEVVVASETPPPPVAEVTSLENRFDRCEQRIGYVFRDRELLRAALTHASGADHRLDSNERLEFLGDAVLGFVVCDLLFKRYPKYLEGDLTKVKSIVVSRQTCARLSRQLGLDEYLIVGKGMASVRSYPPSLLADVFESLLAAIYLDSGEGAAREFIIRQLGPEIEMAAGGGHGVNYKSLLQQLAQRQFGGTPTYRLLEERGPDHSKSFLMAATVGNRSFHAAWGRNKKESEQRAARNALCEVRGEPIPYQEPEPSFPRAASARAQPPAAGDDLPLDESPIGLPDVPHELLSTDIAERLEGLADEVEANLVRAADTSTDPAPPFAAGAIEACAESCAVERDALDGSAGAFEAGLIELPAEAALDFTEPFVVEVAPHPDGGCAAYACDLPASRSQDLSAEPDALPAVPPASTCSSSDAC